MGKIIEFPQANTERYIKMTGYADKCQNNDTHVFIASLLKKHLPDPNKTDEQFLIEAKKMAMSLEAKIKKKLD